MNETFYKQVTKIFGTEHERFIVGMIMYAAADEGCLTVDAAGKVKLTKEQAFDLLVRGAIVKVGTAYYKPVKFEETDGYLTVAVAGDIDNMVFYTAEKSE